MVNWWADHIMLFIAHIMVFMVRMQSLMSLDG